MRVCVTHSLCKVSGDTALTSQAMGEPKSWVRVPYPGPCTGTSQGPRKENLDVLRREQNQTNRVYFFCQQSLLAAAQPTHSELPCSGARKSSDPEGILLIPTCTVFPNSQLHNVPESHLPRSRWLHSFNLWKISKKYLCRKHHLKRSPTGSASCPSRC